MILNMSGGGGSAAALNFKVVGGTTEPTNPSENTIWVNTNTEITSWIFSATKPSEPSEGMVWISTGKSSSVAFNALKKNGIQVYPIGAYQYISGEWISKDATTNQGGEWISWVTYLYYLLNDYSGITGGWTATKWNGGSEQTLTMEADGTGVMTFTSATTGGTGRMGYFYTNNAIDLTDYSKICWNVTADGGPSDYTSINHQLFVFSGNDCTTKTAYTYITPQTAGLYEIDISALIGEYKLGACMTNHTGSTHYLSFDSIWLE